MTVQLWWRDDDAGRYDPRLARLLDLAVATERPVALAVVPDWLDPETVDRILACPLATVIQHGVGHVDHASAGAKTVELGGAVDRNRLDDGLVAGRDRLAAAFGDRFLPILAPPWNRIDDDVTARLPGLGFKGISCFGGPPLTLPLPRIDVHVDAVAWDQGRTPKPAAEVLDELTQQVDAAAGAPVGLMTHHLVVRPSDWSDLDHILRFGHDVNTFAWLAVGELFERP